MHVGLCGTELCSVLDPTGGLERCVQLWAEELVKYCRVTLIDLAETKTSEPSWLRQKKIHYVNCSNIERLPRLLSELQIDVAHLQNRPLVKTGIPTIVTFHNYPYAWSHNLDIDKELLRLMLKDRYITAVSHTLLKESISFIGGNGMKSFLLRPPIAREFFTEQHLGGNGLLFASRLMRKKGVEIAVCAIKEVGAAASSTFLDTTTPFLRNSLEYLEMKQLIINAGIDLLPAANGTREMAKLYAASDVVLQVSLENEGLGLIPLEAQAVGTNVIAAGPGGLIETVFGSNIYLAEASSDKIASAISHFLANPSPTTPPELREYSPIASGKKLFSIIEDLFKNRN